MSELNRTQRTHRPRIQSLRGFPMKEEPVDLSYLQKSLEKQNIFKDNDEMAYFIPEQPQLQMEDRLWKFFLRKTQHTHSKVERQKVNHWEKLIKTILKQTDKKLISNKYNLKELTTLEQQYYKQTHAMYKEIERTKPKHKDNAQILKKNIQAINGEINDIQSDKRKAEQEIDKISNQKLSFLLHLLKKGYYLSDGVLFILQTLKSMSYRPQPTDFPSFLDKKSIDFLYWQYDYHSRPKTKQQKTRNKSFSTINQLAKPDKLKQIYHGTKLYLLDWVQKEGWRDTMSKLPKLNQTKTQLKVDEGEMRVKQQRRRIKNSYGEDIRARVKKIELGIRLQN